MKYISKINKKFIPSKKKKNQSIKKIESKKKYK